MVCILFDLKLLKEVSFIYFRWYCLFLIDDLIEKLLKIDVSVLILLICLDF